MIRRLIDWCTQNRFLVFTGTAVLTALGVWAMTTTPLDAVPDISDVQVIISTEWTGRSPDLIEDQVTYPIVTALISAPRVRTVRGFTEFGISYVYVIFEDGTDIYWARSRVVEYLQGIGNRLPEGVTPAIGPDATGVGWVFEYALVDETGTQDLANLRGLQDWYLRYALASIEGVAEVASIGGFVKQYQVNLDPARLAAYDMSVRDVVDAIRASNNDVEGRLLEFAGREYMVRGRGYLQSIEDIEQVSLGADGRGTPVRVRDVADVRIGPDIRRGVAELDGRGEVVGGIVVMRFGENALGVIERVKAKLREIRRVAAGRRTRRADLRPVVAHRTVDRHAAADAHRGSGRRLAGHRPVPLSRPVGARADPRAAGGRAGRVHPDVRARASAPTSCRSAASRSPSASWWTRRSSWSRMRTGGSPRRRMATPSPTKSSRGRS